MKIVQSFWTLPSVSRVDIQSREHGGWLNKRYHYLGMALSCLLLRRFYKNVELITDDAGKDLLINKLKLPYTKVINKLDDLNEYPPTLWALPKLYAYSIQKEPFLHVDGDVFIWRAFNKKICKGGIIAQSPELEHSFAYECSLDCINEISVKLPMALNNLPNKNIHSLNAGVLGGNDIDFINTYAVSAINSVNENLDILKKEQSAGLFNIIIEQLYLYNMCRLNDKEINFIIPSLSEHLNEVVDFSRIPFERTFIHLMGAYKKEHEFCEQVEFRLKYEFPDYYNSIIDKINEMSNSETRGYNELLSKKVIISNYKLFERTKFLVYKNSDYPDKVNNKVINHFIRNLSDKGYKKYIKDIYKLDSEIKKTIETEPNWVLDRWEKLCEVYDFLGSRSREKIMNHLLKLAPGQRIISTCWALDELNLLYNDSCIKYPDYDENKFIIITKLKSDFKEEELLDANLLLIYFYNNVLSGNDLVSIMQKNTVFNKELLEEKVLSFILFELVYSGRLILQASV